MYLVRVHRTQRKALFTPDNRCPAPTDRLENYRRTIVKRKDGNKEDFEEKFQDLDKKQQKKILQAQHWAGETWFKVKRGTPLPGNKPPAPAPAAAMRQPAQLQAETMHHQHRHTDTPPRRL